MRLTPYIPVILFGAWGLYSSWRRPSWRGNPRYLKQRTGRYGASGSSSAIAHGQRKDALRNGVMRDMGIALLLGVVGVLLTLALEARGYQITHDTPL